MQAVGKWGDLYGFRIQMYRVSLFIWVQFRGRTPTEWIILSGNPRHEESYLRLISLEIIQSYIKARIRQFDTCIGLFTKRREGFTLDYRGGVSRFLYQV